MVSSEEQGLKNGKKGSTPGSPQILHANGGLGAESSEDEREGKEFFLMKLWIVELSFPIKTSVIS